MNRPLTASEARAELGMPSSTFWKFVHEKNVPRIEYSPRNIRFDRAVIAKLKAAFTVRTPADRDRLADGRRSWEKFQ